MCAKMKNKSKFALPNRMLKGLAARKHAPEITYKSKNGHLPYSNTGFSYRYKREILTTSKL